MSKKFSVGLRIDENCIDINEINSISVNLYEEKIKAKEKLLRYKEILGRKIEANFDNNIWRFEHIGYQNQIVFDFTKISPLIKFDKTMNENDFISIVKCWIANQLDVKSLNTVSSYFRVLLSGIFTTSGFNLVHSDTLIRYLEQSCYFVVADIHNYELKEAKQNSLLIQYISVIKSFLEFYNRDKYSSLLKALLDVRNKKLHVQKYRKLPSFKDILKFKIYLDHWFEEATRENKKSELISFFPLILWWRLTSLIPMRPLEFCQIRRDCLTVELNKYYITFPRFKFHRNGEYRNNIYYDTLPIPIEIYNLFDIYIRLTEQFGVSEFLLHKIAFINETLDKFNSSNADKNFNTPQLSVMLGKFYKKIIFDKFNVNLLSIKGRYSGAFKFKENHIKTSATDSLETMLSVGDLRHIAIINMMMQGYDKVEIQRLAGHITYESQFNYFNHMENWMDVEILRLEREFRMNSYSTPITSSNIKFPDIPHPKVIDFFENEHKKVYVTMTSNNEVTNKFIQLKIGYCKDESMPCPTFNWGHNGCYFCTHWYIPSEELEQKREIIINDLNIIYNGLKMKIVFLKSLYEKHFDEHGYSDVNTKSSLSSTANELQLGIRHVAKLKYMLGVNEL